MKGFLSVPWHYALLSNWYQWFPHWGICMVFEEDIQKALCEIQTNKRTETRISYRIVEWHQIIIIILINLPGRGHIYKEREDINLVIYKVVLWVVKYFAVKPNLRLPGESNANSLAIHVVMLILYDVLKRNTDILMLRHSM